jgi:hypothetical protein
MFGETPGRSVRDRVVDGCIALFGHGHVLRVFVMRWIVMRACETWSTMPSRRLAYGLMAGSYDASTSSAALDLELS